MVCCQEEEEEEEAVIYLSADRSAETLPEGFTLEKERGGGREENTKKRKVERRTLLAMSAWAELASIFPTGSFLLSSLSLSAHCSGRCMHKPISQSERLRVRALWKMKHVAWLFQALCSVLMVTTLWLTMY